MRTKLLVHLIALQLSGILFLSSPGCQSQKSRPQEKPITQLQLQSLNVPTFDRQQAFTFLTTQTDFGPRVPNTDAHARCLAYLESELHKSSQNVTLQSFTQPGYDGVSLQLTNIIASFNLAATSRILLCAHWDSRPWADQDQDPKNVNKGMPGANDGASGVAILLEVARLMMEHQPPVGVDIVLFDGEDYGHAQDLSNYLLGSRYFAHTKPGSFAPMFGILLDMVGDKQLEIRKERNSLKFAPDIVQLVWSIARDVGSSSFVDEIGHEIYDDHLPLNQAGIKTIDLIDFDYPDASNRYWHTMQDTPDNCSPESLEEVGRVLLHLIYRLSS